jgi:hypothetical protein
MPSNGVVDSCPQMSRAAQPLIGYYFLCERIFCWILFLKVLNRRITNGTKPGDDVEPKYWYWWGSAGCGWQEPSAHKTTKAIGYPLLTST